MPSSFDPIPPSSYHLNIWLLSHYQFVKEWSVSKVSTSIPGIF